MIFFVVRYGITEEMMFYIKQSRRMTTEFNMLSGPLTNVLDWLIYNLQKAFIPSMNYFLPGILNPVLMSHTCFGIFWFKSTFIFEHSEFVEFAEKHDCRLNVTSNVPSFCRSSNNILKFNRNRPLLRFLRNHTYLKAYDTLKLFTTETKQLQDLIWGCSYAVIEIWNKNCTCRLALHWAHLNFKEFYIHRQWFAYGCHQRTINWM